MKKVQFNEDLNQIQFTTKHDAYSRGIHWEIVAADRFRFKQRVFKMGYIINPILEIIHRKKMYERFK